MNPSVLYLVRITGIKITAHRTVITCSGYGFVQVYYGTNAHGSTRAFPHSHALSQQRWYRKKDHRMPFSESASSLSDERFFSTYPLLSYAKASDYFYYTHLHEICQAVLLHFDIFVIFHRFLLYHILTLLSYYVHKIFSIVSVIYSIIEIG